MIPKVLHYCWFGKNPLPELVKKCIESWKVFCPDYKIIEWNESNFDISSNEYIKAAYENKKYAFVADYARFVILEKFGGIYMDTDVEIIRAFPDEILRNHVFIGREEIERINPGLIIGAEPGSVFCKEMIQMYDKQSFYNVDGTLNCVTIVDYTSQYLSNKGWIPENKNQVIDSIVLYTPDYFCPKSVKTGVTKLTSNSLTIHHFDGSWFTDEEKKRAILQRKFHRVLGFKVGSKVLGSYYYLKDHGFQSTIKHTYDTLRGKKNER